MVEVTAVIWAIWKARNSACFKTKSGQRSLSKFSTVFLTGLTIGVISMWRRPQSWSCSRAQGCWEKLRMKFSGRKEYGCLGCQGCRLEARKRKRWPTKGRCRSVFDTKFCCLVPKLCPHWVPGIFFLWFSLKYLATAWVVFRLCCVADVTNSNVSINRNQGSTHFIKKNNSRTICFQDLYRDIWGC
jgi:hypothetical protein